jgi:hypothetical protein
VKIRVEGKNHEIVSIDLSGEWRAEPVELHCLVGPTVSHFFTDDGYYDHAEPRSDVSTPTSVPKTKSGMEVGPTDGTSCIP